MFGKTNLLLLLFILLTSSCIGENEEQNKPKENSNQNNLALSKYSGTSSDSEQDHKNLSDRISSSRENAITNAVEKCSRAIVSIVVTEVRRVEYRDPFTDDPFFRFFFGQRRSPRYREYEMKALGSGFIISPDGYVLTNHHVAGNASKVIVTMTDGSEHEAEIIGTDQTSDVSLLKIEGDDFPYLNLGDSEDLKRGEWVIAFGFPFGMLIRNSNPTVTVGVISNLGYSFVQQNTIYKDMIQTDAAISSGNSGGPLVNANGDVVGINTVIFSTAQTRQGAGSIGIGFAIPINRVKFVVEKLKEDGYVNRNYVVGIEVSKIDNKIAKYFGLKTTDGVVVINLWRDTPAYDAGIEPGDIILEIDGNQVHQDDDYLIAIGDAIVGQKLELKILRDDKIIRKTITLKERKK